MSKTIEIISNTADIDVFCRTEKGIKSRMTIDFLDETPDLQKITLPNGFRARVDILLIKLTDDK